MNLYKVEVKPVQDSKPESIYCAVVMAVNDQEAENKAREICPGFESVVSQGTINYVLVSDYTLVPRAWG
jgi:hypothetical protein